MADMKTAFAKALSTGSAESDHERYCRQLKQGLDSNQCKAIDAMLVAKDKWVSRSKLRMALQPLDETQAGVIVNSLLKAERLLTHKKDLWYVCLPDPYEMLRRESVEALPTITTVRNMIPLSLEIKGEKFGVVATATALVDGTVQTIRDEIHYHPPRTFPATLTEDECDYISDRYVGLCQDNNGEHFDMSLLLRDEQGNVYREETHSYWITGSLQLDEAIRIANIAASMTYVCDYGEIIRPNILRSMHDPTQIVIMLMDWDGEPALSKMEGHNAERNSSAA